MRSVVENLMDWDQAEKLGLKSKFIDRSIKARLLNGTELFTITHITEPFQMHINDHREHINFYLFKASSHALILGHPCLCRHEPHINWKIGEIRGWGKDCLENCLNSSTQGENLSDINLLLLCSKP